MTEKEIKIEMLKLAGYCGSRVHKGCWTQDGDDYYHSDQLDLRTINRDALKNIKTHDQYHDLAKELDGSQLAMAILKTLGKWRRNDASIVCPICNLSTCKDHGYTD